MQTGTYLDCDGSAVQQGYILVSGIYIDGLYGTGGQYVIELSGNAHKVKYWEQSAVVNITTRLNGKVPLLTSSEADDARVATKATAVSSNTDHEEVDIAHKVISLDVVWRFKVDLTPASSGTAGDNYKNTATATTMRKPHGWSYPDNKHADDRLRKSIPHDEAMKLVASLRKIRQLAASHAQVTVQGQV